jgi:hypothetical protein
MATPIQRSFAGGEIAPSLYARVDTVKYATGLRDCRNFFIPRHGSAVNRSGSEFVAEVKTSTLTVRLIPFVFNSSQTYVLEFGNLYMRVHQNGAQLTDLSKTITGVTNANPAVITAASHGFTAGQEITISGVAGMTQLNGRNFKVGTVVNPNSFQISQMDGTNVNSNSYGVYSSGGTADRVYEISTTYATADLATLQFVQSADVITIVHPSYAPKELSRSGHTTWTLASISFAPEIGRPVKYQVTLNGVHTGSTVHTYVVTAVHPETGEESLVSDEMDSPNADATLTTDKSASIVWYNGSYPVDGGGVPVSNYTSGTTFNIYKEVNGIYGYIGNSSSLCIFIDIGYIPDTSTTPPTARNPFGSSNNYPSAVSYHQQRRVFGNSNNDPEKIWGSRTGNHNNFTISFPMQDDNAVTFSLAGRQVNSVKHILDLAQMVVMTASGEWVIQGDEAGILKPAEINPKQHSYNGSSTLPPIVINGDALYVQARGSIVRDLGFDPSANAVKGGDLTVFSAHLFEGYTISDWAYQQIPNSIVWAVRSDGVLLGCTYVREQQMLAWHRHDFTDGTVENVCVVPEGNEDILYIVVKRTINSRTTRYIERVSSRYFDDVLDATILDSFLSYDGRNTSSSHTMTLSGGTNWVYTETLTLTSSSSYFTTADVGNSIQITGSDGTIVRCEITNHLSGTVVECRPNKTVPVAMRSAAISDWVRAVDEVSGLWHLEGQDVSIFADGFVVANPTNSSYTVKTVSNGIVTLDKDYGVIHVGLPITADLQTLDIDTNEGETLANKKMIVNAVTLFVEKTRGLWVGPKAPTDDDDNPLEGLREIKTRDSEGYDSPVDLKTDKVSVQITSQWNSNGRVFIRQIDPLPASILAIAPSGMQPYRGN